MIRKGLLFAILLLLILPAAAQDDLLPVGSDAEITTGANIRSGPGGDDDVVAVLRKGTRVTIQEYDSLGWWARISAADGTSGWVAVNLLAAASAGQVAAPGDAGLEGRQMVISVGANIRSDATMDADVVTVAARGTLVTVTDTSYDAHWAYVTLPDGAQGWIAADLLDSVDGTGDEDAEADQADEDVDAPEIPEPLPGSEGNPGDRASLLEQTDLLAEPQAGAEVVTVLPERMELVIEAYNEDRSWVKVRGASGTGWISPDLIEVIVPIELELPEMDLDDIPEHESVPDQMVVPDDPTIARFSGLSDVELATAREIFQRGQQLGNRADAFIKIGDSNMAAFAFFCNFEWGSYNLAEYKYLQSTIDYYNQSGSFCGKNLTAQHGFATTNLLDPLWADPGLCGTDESALLCEIRIKQPSVAFVYLGMADLRFTTVEIFTTNYDEVVRTLIDKGVVPILQTIATADNVTRSHGVYEKVQQINDVIRQTAARYQVPFIDIRAATAPLTNQGCIEEGYHLSFIAENWMSFNGEEYLYGRHMRELLSLQMLHALRLQAFN